MPGLDLRHLLRQSSDASQEPALGNTGRQWDGPLLLVVPGGFSCRLCDAQYKERLEALRCVRRCLLSFVRQQPIQAVVHQTHQHFRCSLCQREYLHRPDALLCFSQCLDLRQELLPTALVSQLGHALALASLPRAKTVEPLKKVKSPDWAVKKLEPSSLKNKLGPQVRVGATNAAAAALANKATQPSEGIAQQRPMAGKETSHDSHGVLDETHKTITAGNLSQNESETPTTGNAAAPPQPEGPFRRRDQKPFTRQDARYMCGACKKKYFTKSEVESCFYSHPIEE